jgi:hypothetical protein
VNRIASLKCRACTAFLTLVIFAGTPGAALADAFRIT